MTWSIAVISPVVDTGLVDVDALLAPMRSDRCVLKNYFLREGPASIEDKADEAACIPDLMRLAHELSGAGVDAIVVICMCDPGVEELQANLGTLVLGPAKTAMHAAAALGRRFSFLDVVEEARDDMFELAARYGLAPSMVSHRAINVPVLELLSDRHLTLDALEAQALVAVLKDGATSLLLGCTVLAEFAPALAERLLARGVTATVIEPVSTTIGFAVAMLDAGMAGSAGRSRA